MSLGLHSLSSQKKGAAFSFVLLAAVTVLVMALFAFATSGPSFAQQFTPRWVQASAVNATVNITISNIAGSTAAIKRVDFTRPSTVANFECGSNLPAGWSCTRSASTVVQFSTAGAGIAAGSSEPFMINITPPANGGNQSFTIDTYESAGGANANTSGNPTIFNVNSSVDNDLPFVQLMNISAMRSDGIRISINGAQTNGLFFLPNTSDGYVFVINASDNASGMDNGRVTLYYNVSTIGTSIVNLIDYRNASLTNVSSFQASNGTIGGPLSLYNVTLNLSSVVANINGTRVAFIILANDSVGNGNVSNSSNAAAVSTFVYNFTIDAVAPQVIGVRVSNSSLSKNAINTTKTWGDFVEYIINSSMLLNLSINVSDDGGAGTIKTEILNRSSAFVNLDLLAGNNGSSRTVWNLSIFNITDLAWSSTGGGFVGDGKYNVTFRLTDNVSNVNSTYNFTVEVDDSPPTASAFTNLTIDASNVLSVGNLSLDASSLANGGQINTSFTLRLQTTSNIDNTTRNVSVFGNKGRIFNLTYSSGTPSTTAIWNLTITNLTVVNLTEFCDMTSADGQQCNFRFNFSDVLGRHNDTINLTIAVDGLAPNVSILSPISMTTNYSTTVLINVSVNDSVGPLQNISYRWRNSTAPGDNTEGGNVSNWIPMSLGSGTNTQFNALGYWNATLTISSLIDGNFSIEINATDSAGRQNATRNVTNVIFDSTIPQNITLFAPATNSFWNAMFNISANATDGISGLLNVSFRLENSSFNWPWVEGSQRVFALTTGQSFNASNWNLTHFGGLPTNATNGNFTLRFNVTDTAGNQNTSIAINLTIDTIVPAVSMVFPGNNQNQSANFTVNISVTESNNNNVQYRWVNVSGGANQGGNWGPWVSMNNGGGVSNWNSTFGNLSDSTNILDGNYTIQLNVTDKAGNVNTSIYIQLLLDKSRPMIEAVSSIANSIQTANFVVNATVNDTYSLNMNLGKLNITNINGTASFRLENASFNSSLVIMNFPVADLQNSESNRTNGTFTFSSIANGNYNLRFFVNDTAGNQNSTVLITNITLDNVAPSVAISILNITPAPSGTTAVSGVMNLNVSVSDNLPLNISLIDNTVPQGATYGTFYRFENSTFNGSWLPMSTLVGTANLSAVFNASNSTTVLVDGDYRVRINVTDRANNQNVSEWISLSIKNSGSVIQAVNETFFEGLWNGAANSSTGGYTFLVNTTGNATCLYSLDSSKRYYNDFGAQTVSNTMSNNGSKEHRIILGSLEDVANRHLYYECKGLSGGGGTNYSGAGGADGATDFAFRIDTSNRWNVTIPGKTSNNWPNYFQPAPNGNSNNGWSSFVLSTGTLAATSLASAQGGYNTTNVLASLLKGTAEGNFTRIYAYTASTNSWETFVVGQGANSFVNFTNQTTYWINVTVRERLEVN